MVLVDGLKAPAGLVPAGAFFGGRLIGVERDERTKRAKCYRRGIEPDQTGEAY